MATLIIPKLDATPWPTLGDQVCDWIEANSVYGPGELAGKRYVVEPEFRAQIYRSYEIYPHGHRLAGRRRFKRAAWSMRKGTAKTEKAVQVAFAESHPDAPVRCDGWRKEGKLFVPVGRGIQHPYIPMVAYTEEQAEDLAYGVLRHIIGASELAADYDIGLDRILVLDQWGREAGKIAALAGSPSARDGARTTFQHFDETHRMALARLKRAYSAMTENLYKRRDADAWGLETTTAFEPGEDSIAEDTYSYAEQVRDGKVDDPRLFFFHRQTPDAAPMESLADVRAALEEASGPAVEWSGDIDGLVSRWFEPKTDREYYRRVWLNQPRSPNSKAFDVEQWLTLARPELEVPKGELITLGFDGSRFNDATALIAERVVDAHQWVAGVWERPRNLRRDQAWEVPLVDVDLAVQKAFRTWSVWRMYADPWWFEEKLDEWSGRWGDAVVPWPTNRVRQTAYAVRSYVLAIRNGELSHEGHPAFDRHIANAHKAKTTLLDPDTEEPLYLLRKERPDSPNKIDLAMAGTLAHEARGDAIAAGALKVVDRTLRTRRRR